MISCNTFCLDQKCRDRKACACQCVSLFGGSNPVLVDACRARCMTDTKSASSVQTSDEWVCKYVGAQDAYNRHGIICKGFDPLQSSAQGKAYATQSGSSSKLYIGLGVAILLLLFIFLTD